jgi:hypothetical protein
VRLGKSDPGQMNYFYLSTVGGIDVYHQDKVANYYKELTVKLEKLFFFKKLVAV